MVLLKIQNMVKLMDKKIVTVLHIKSLLFWTSIPVVLLCLFVFVCFIALRPKSTAMVSSPNHTFSGQAWTSG